MPLNIPAAQQALKETETVDGLRLEGPNRKISMMLSLHGHLEDALQELDRRAQEYDGAFGKTVSETEVTPAQCTTILGRDASAKERREAIDGLIAYATRLESEQNVKGGKATSARLQILANDCWRTATTNEDYALSPGEQHQLARLVLGE